SSPVRAPERLNQQRVIELLQVGDFYLIEIAIGHWFLRSVITGNRSELKHVLVAQDSSYEKMVKRGLECARAAKGRLLKHVATTFRFNFAMSSYALLADCRDD